MLKIKDLNSFYGSSQILYNVSIKISIGECVSILGKNGMGKTTTIHSIMGIISSKSGKIYFENKDISNEQPYVIAKAGIGFVPESRRIFPNLTVKEHLIAFAHNKNIFNKTMPWDIPRIFSLFPQLKDRRNSMGNQLSGGEQQMLAISRALITNPKLLILDEATEGLDPIMRSEIWKCLNLLKKENLSILIVDKNVTSLSKLSNRHYIINNGKIVWTGNSKELLKNNKLINNYLTI